MKNAIIFALLFALAILAFGTRNEAQAVIEDTTKGQTFGLRSASEETARLPTAMPNGFRPQPLVSRKHEQRVAGPPVPLAAGIGLSSNAATDTAASTNPPVKQADWQACVMIPTGPIRRPDNYSAKPHGRRSDNA